MSHMRKRCGRCLVAHRTEAWVWARGQLHALPAGAKLLRHDYLLGAQSSLMNLSAELGHKKGRQTALRTAPAFSYPLPWAPPHRLNEPRIYFLLGSSAGLT